VLAFRTAAYWLPHPAPPLPVRYVEITEDSGHCVAASVYSSAWGIAPRYLDLMQWQVVIHLAGGVAEAISRGERRRHEVLTFAQRARAVLDDLRTLTGRRHDAQPFAMRAMGLLLAHWPAVAALAAALIDNHRIEGDHVERIMERIALCPS
jgi:hypothetical protein